MFDAVYFTYCIKLINLKGADSVFLLKPDGTKVPYSEIAK